MDYSYDFAKIKANYPEKIGLEQMRVICHISKKTARYLLTSGLVPCIDTGKKTRQYIINTKDVITYLKKRQSQPEKFSAPTGYYSASWNKGGKPKTLTLREWANLDTAKSRKKFQDFLTLKMQPYSDVLSVAEASRFTGYHHNTLTNWCHNGYILHDGVAVLDADGIVEPPHSSAAVPKVSEFAGLAERGGVPDHMIVNMGFVDMGADDIGVIALGEALGQFTAQTIRFLRCDLTGDKGLPQMVGNHIILAAHSAGLLDVLILGEKKLGVSDPAVTLPARYQPAAVRLLRILDISYIH